MSALNDRVTIKEINMKGEVAEMGNYEITADVEKNRLYISVEGLLLPKENRESVDRILEEIKKLRLGFDIIADIAKMKVSTQEGLKEFDRAAEAFGAIGMRCNIIVVEDAIARMQIKRYVSKNEESRNEYASSVEEAEKMLDSVE